MIYFKKKYTYQARDISYVQALDTLNILAVPGAWSPSAHTQNRYLQRP